MDQRSGLVTAPGGLEGFHHTAIQRARGEVAPVPVGGPQPEGLTGSPYYERFAKFSPVEHAHRITAPTIIIDAKQEHYFDIREHGQRVAPNPVRPRPRRVPRLGDGPLRHLQRRLARQGNGGRNRLLRPPLEVVASRERLREVCPRAHGRRSAERHSRGGPDPVLSVRRGAGARRGVRACVGMRAEELAVPGPFQSKVQRSTLGAGGGLHSRGSRAVPAPSCRFRSGFLTSVTEVPGFGTALLLPEAALAAALPRAVRRPRPGRLRLRCGTLRGVPSGMPWPQCSSMTEAGARDAAGHDDAAARWGEGVFQALEDQGGTGDGRQVGGVVDVRDGAAGGGVAGLVVAFDGETRPPPRCPRRGVRGTPLP